jgi:acylphosphatase
MDRVRVHLTIHGLVQGVAFRAYTEDEARRLGVKGWVRNLPDGRVEAEAEGERSAVEALVAWCRHGPPAARVEGVQATWGTYRGDLGAFTTRH